MLVVAVYIPGGDGGGAKDLSVPITLKKLGLTLPPPPPPLSHTDPGLEVNVSDHLHVGTLYLLQLCERQCRHFLSRFFRLIWSEIWPPKREVIAR